MMKYDEIIKNLPRELWGKRNFREFKEDLLKDVQIEVKNFKPIKKTSYSNNPIQVIDLFSGAGGTSLGFAAVNKLIPAFNFLGGVDINYVSADTYSHNYDTPILNEDITKLAYENGYLEEILEKVNYDPKKPLILIGCAPCQGFSSHRKKHWSEEDDIRNSLIIAYAKIVEKLNPDVIVMENVPEFLSKRYWKYFIAAKKEFNKCGYIVKQHIYNAASFSVPQERFRSIVIGMKREFMLPIAQISREYYVTVRQAIGDLPPVKAGVADSHDWMHKSASHKQSTIDVIKQVPMDGGNRPAGIGPSCLDKTNGFSDVYGRLWWDRPAITITHYARNPASGRYTHPQQHRGLTAREAARLQSFPDGFEFTGKMDDVYRQIGEAVPPMLSAAVATNILVELMSLCPTNQELLGSPTSIECPVSSSYSSVIAGIKNKEKVVER